MCLDVFVSEGFLAREVGPPSAASDLPPSDHDLAIWLVEPRRTKSVQKFSGTLVHPNHYDKVGITLVAFTHFTYEVSHKELVFADIQGMRILTAQKPDDSNNHTIGSPMSIKGRDSLVLFDLMSHSPAG